MRKIISFLALLVIAFALPHRAQAMTVYWDNSSKKWESPRCHYWGGSSESSWPGVNMTKFYGSIWSYEIPDNSTGVIFNMGSNSEQTGNLTPVDGHLYNANGDQGEYPTITVYFDNSQKNYSKPKCYCWSGSDNNVWPGKDMTLVEGNIWKIEIPAAAANLLFCYSGNDDKTGNFTVAAGHLYNASGDQGEYGSTTWDFSGNTNPSAINLSLEYSGSNQLIGMTFADSQWTAEFTAQKTEQEFKFNIGGGWYGYSEGTVSANATGWTEILVDKDTGKCKFTDLTAGVTYRVILTGKSSTSCNMKIQPATAPWDFSGKTRPSSVKATSVTGADATELTFNYDGTQEVYKWISPKFKATAASIAFKLELKDGSETLILGKDLTGDLGSEVAGTTSDGNSGTYKEGNLTVGKYYQIEIAAVKDNMFKYKVVDVLPDNLYLYTSKSDWSTQVTPTSVSDGVYTFTYTFAQGEYFVLTTSTGSGYDALKENWYTHGTTNTTVQNGVASSFYNTKTSSWEAPIDGTYDITVNWTAQTLTATWAEGPLDLSTVTAVSVEFSNQAISLPLTKTGDVWSGKVTFTTLNGENDPKTYANFYLKVKKSDGTPAKYGLNAGADALDKWADVAFGYGNVYFQGGLATRKNYLVEVKPSTTSNQFQFRFTEAAVAPWDFRTNTKPTAVSIHLTEDNADHALTFSNGIWSGTFVIDSENGSNYIHYYINATDDAGSITKFGTDKGTGNLGAWSEKTSCNEAYWKDSYQGNITAGKKYKVEVTAEAANEYKVRFTELYTTLYLYSTDGPTQIGEATVDAEGKYVFNLHLDAGTSLVLCTQSGLTDWSKINGNRYSPKNGNTDIPNADVPFIKFVSDQATPGAWQSTVAGNYTITVDWIAQTLTATCTSAPVPVPENVYLPLSSLDFEGGKKHYFLVGERQGEWHLQPEWEFTVVEDAVDGDKLVLENRFMYNGSFAVAVVDNYNDYVYHKYTYYGDDTVFKSGTLTSGNISGNATRYEVIKGGNQILKHNTGKHVFWSEMDGYGDDSYWNGVGTLMSRIEVTLTAGVPQTVTLTPADAKTTNENRLFTLVGNKIYNQNYSLTSADGVKTTMQTRGYSTFDGWQEGWIQYDRNTGKAYVDGNGEYLYHTSFTPDYMMNNPALFNMDVTGGEFSYSSQETQFVEWNKLPNLETDPYWSFYQAFSGPQTIDNSGIIKQKDAKGTDMGYDFTVQVENNNPVTTSTAGWDCYVVRDMWIAGEIKFWTGWGGNTKLTYGDKTGAAWHGMNGGPDDAVHGRKVVKGFDITSGTAATLYKNGQNIDDCNYKIGDGVTPAYFNRVVLWINNTDGVSKSYIQFVQESAGPAIAAQVATNTEATPNKNNWLKYNWYLNAAQNESDNDRKVVGYEITRYRMDNGVEVFDGYPKGGYVSVAEQNVKVSDLLKGSGTMPDWTTFTDESAVSNLGFTPGLYRYKITITLDSDGGPTKTATSNQVAIYSDEAVTLQPMALQLVKLSEEGKTALGTSNEYLTYSPSNNATFYAMNLADETQTIDSKSVKVAFPTGTIDEIPGAKALKFLNENPDKYWWTSDYYVRCLDYDVYKAELQKQVNAGAIQAVPVPKVEMKETFVGDPISRGVAQLLTHNGHNYYSLVMKRGGNVAQGTILTTLTYTTTNADGSLHNYESKATLTIDPVLPQPYGLTYGYDYIRETVPVTYEGKQWAKVNVPSGHWDNASTATTPVYVKLDNNFRPDRLDLNVKFNRPNVVEEIYNKYDIVYGVSLGVKGGGSNLMFTAVDGESTSENFNKPYTITVNGVNPENGNVHVFNFATTTYEPTATAKAANSELGRNNGTFGAAPSVDTKHTIRVNTGTGFEELYLGMIERNNSTWDWMYKGHKNFVDADDQLEGSTDTQCTTVPEAIKPLYYLVELKDGSNSSNTTTYEYLVPHIANHHPGNTYDFHNSYKYLLDDSDPLIGTYVAKDFGAATPTLYATAMYLFEQKYEAVSKVAEGYNTVTIDSPAATLRRVNTAPGANPAAGNFGDLPDTGVVQDTAVVEDKTGNESTGMPAYAAVAGATYFMTPGDKMVTGVEDVLADGEGAEAVYYNLQGVRVDNPASAGVYIRVQGKNVSKVVVK